MELKEKITLDMLTKDSVSVLRQQFLTFNGEEMQVGGNIRNAYMNSKSGREQLKTVLSDEYYNAVMAVWYFSWHSWWYLCKQPNVKLSNRTARKES